MPSRLRLLSALVLAPFAGFVAALLVAWPPFVRDEVKGIVILALGPVLMVGASLVVLAGNER